MTRRRFPCIQDDLPYRLEQQPTAQTQCPMVVTLILFVCSLLGICDTDQISGDWMDQPENSTVAENSFIMTTEPNIKLNYHLHMDNKLNITQDLNETNDVITRLGLNSRTNYESIDKDVSAPVNHLTNTQTENQTESSFSSDSEPYTRKPIYIQGHLLKHPPSGKKTFHPPDTPEGYFRTNNSIHLHRVLNFRKDSDSENTSNRQKRKHIPNKERFHNYKMLYDSINSNMDKKRKRTEFYAWMFGAAMLGLGSLTTVTTCIVFCFCVNKNQPTQNTSVQPRNTPSRHSGEYQRVESVSSIVSIVDHAGDYTDSLYEEHRHSVTII